MESLIWFGFSSHGDMACHSVDAQTCMLFLCKHPHWVVELDVMEGNKEVSQLREGEEPLLVKADWETVSQVFEIDKTICYLDIQFEAGGGIHYLMGQLNVQYPEGMDLTVPVRKLLEMYGYYAGDEIISFCLKHRGKHYLPFVMGLHPEEITDEFESMLEYTKEVDKIRAML